MKIVRVKILGTTYPIKVKGGKEEKYINSLAHYVDGKIRKLTLSGSQVLSSKLAVKAALNIADELHRVKEKGNLNDRERGARYRKLIKLLDEGLK